MKTKMEKMKEMKEKISEKMKGTEGMKTKDLNSEGKASGSSKDAHEH